MRDLNENQIYNYVKEVENKCVDTAFTVLRGISLYILRWFNLLFKWLMYISTIMCGLFKEKGWIIKCLVSTIISLNWRINIENIINCFINHDSNTKNQSNKSKKCNNYLVYFLFIEFLESSFSNKNFLNQK